MGNPVNYSTELPDRCLALIDGLWDGVHGLEGHASKYGGPLTTTFLLAMATPIILLPLERVVAQRANEFADDRVVDAQLADRISRLLGGAARLRHCPFYADDQGWAYSRQMEPFNIARGMPEGIAEELSTAQARAAAADLAPHEFLSALRNALAHGVIGFLDERGRSTYGEISTMLAFVGQETKNRQFVALHVLRVSETGFRSFLRQWVKWLNETGLSEAMAA